MIIEAFLFGITIAIAIGPIALLIVNASINRGMKAGLACGAGAAFADFTFALCAFLAGQTLLAPLETQRGRISEFAALFLCGLGAWLAWQAWRRRDALHVAQGVRDPGFLGTWLVTLANPLTVLLFTAWLGSRRMSVSPTDSFLLALAVFSGSLLVQSALVLSGGALRPLLARPGTLFAANLLSAAGIVAIGVFQFIRS